MAGVCTLYSNRCASDSDLLLRIRHKKPKWIRVFPPEPERNIAGEFRVRQTGIKDCPVRNSSSILYFYPFFTDFIWNFIVRETNRYTNIIIENKRNAGQLGPRSRFRNWVDVTVKDLKQYMGLVINMGITHRNNVNDYNTMYMFSL